MKFLSTAIICAIVCATSVTAVENQEQQQGSQKPCNERNEQECKEPECISTVKYVHGVGGKAALESLCSASNQSSMWSIENIFI